MKSNPGLILLAGAAMLLSAPSFAAKDNTNYLNGKPFSELNTLIQSNSAAIESLTVVTDELRTDIDQNAADLDALELRVSTNESNITDIYSKIADLNIKDKLLQSEIKTLETNLTALTGRVDDNEAAIASNEADIAEMDAALVALGLKVNINRKLVLAYIMQIDAELASQQFQLNSLVKGLKTLERSTAGQIARLYDEIAYLQSQVDKNASITAAKLAAANYRIGRLNSQVSWLTGNINDLRSRYSRHTHSVIQRIEHVHSVIHRHYYQEWVAGYSHTSYHCDGHHDTHPNGYNVCHSTYHSHAGYWRRTYTNHVHTYTETHISDTNYETTLPQ